MQFINDYVIHNHFTTAWIYISSAIAIKPQQILSSPTNSQLQIISYLEKFSTHIFGPSRKSIRMYQTIVSHMHVPGILINFTTFHLNRPEDMRQKADLIFVIFGGNISRYLSKSYGHIFGRPRKPIPRCTTRVPNGHVYNISFESVQPS